MLEKSGRCKKKKGRREERKYQDVCKSLFLRFSPYQSNLGLQPLGTSTASLS